MTTFDRYEKKECRYSKTPLPHAFLDLGLSPLANSLVPKDQKNEVEFKCPLRLARNPDSGLVQLTHVVPPDLLFKNYLYVSSTTETFKKHFAEYARAVKEQVIRKSDPLAIDIGSNDGLLVSCYMKNGMRGAGVDPAENLARDANARGIPTINRYFDADSVKEIIGKYGRADAISGNNVFAHIDDIHDVCRNVLELMRDDGLFVIEFPYLMTMLKGLLFDMIYHEHLSYIAVTSLQYLLGRFDMEIFLIQEVSSHGGSLRVFAQRKGGPRAVSPIVGKFLEAEKREGIHSEEPYRIFADRVMKIKKDLNDAVQKIKSEGKTIAGYGAPAKATTIINFCDLTDQQIDFIVDDNPLKQGYLVPGAKIPIVPSQYLRDHPTDYVIIFAWNFANEIVAKNQDLLERNVKFLVPLPKLTLINAERLQKNKK